jgi:hypothetical protein
MKPVDMWTHPADQPTLFETYGQIMDNAVRYPQLAHIRWLCDHIPTGSIISFIYSLFFSESGNVGFRFRFSSLIRQKIVLTKGSTILGTDRTVRTMLHFRRGK